MVGPLGISNAHCGVTKTYNLAMQTLELLEG